MAASQVQIFQFRAPRIRSVICFFSILVFSAAITLLLSTYVDDTDIHVHSFREMISSHGYIRSENTSPKFSPDVTSAVEWSKESSPVMTNSINKTNSTILSILSIGASKDRFSEQMAYLEPGQALPNRQSIDDSAHRPHLQFAAPLVKKGGNRSITRAGAGHMILFLHLHK